jgi:hypothetical protein
MIQPIDALPAGNIPSSVHSRIPGSSLGAVGLD